MNDLFDICPCDDSERADTPTMPLIGDPAPEFTAQTTNGPIDFPSDYAGRWVVLFSRPILHRYAHLNLWRFRR